MTINAPNISFSIAVASDGKRYSRYPDGQFPGVSGTIFTDGFESGDKSHTENDATWTSSTNTAVQSGRGYGGTYSLQFTFVGTPDASDPQNSIAEQRYQLGALYDELTLYFKLYIPDGTESWGGAAYVHRNASSGGENNKFMRFWSDIDGANRDLVGFSTLPNASDEGSDIRGEWYKPSGGTTTRGAARTPLIRNSDRGTWMKIKVHVKAATASTNGTLNLYAWRHDDSDYVLLLDNTDVVDNYDAAYPMAWRYGYFLGAANTGFLATTYMQIDDVQWDAGAT